MRRYLAYAFFLILVAAGALLAFDSLCVALVKQSQGTEIYKMYRLFADHPSDEIPIFGSSRAASNFAPSLIDPKAFCYGIDGSGMNETLFLLENYLKRNPTGGEIIVNLDPWGFPESHEGGFVADYTLSPISPKPQCSIPGVRMIGKLRNIIAAWLNQRIAGTKRIDQGAILQLVDRTDSEWKFLNARVTERSFSVSSYWKERILRLADLSPRTIRWVVGPCSPRWKELFRNESDLNVFCRWLGEQPHQRVINLFSLPYADSSFMDPMHLNEKGAREFTLQLSRELRKTE